VGFFIAKEIFQIFITTVFSYANTDSNDAYQDISHQIGAKKEGAIKAP